MQAICFRFLFFLVSWFALWTVGSNWISLGGRPAMLLKYWIVISALATLGAIAIFGKRIVFDEMPNSIASLTSLGKTDHNNRTFITVLALGGICISLMTYKLQSAWLFFGCLSVLLAASFAIFHRRCVAVFSQPRRAVGGRDGLGLFLLFILLLAFYFFGHQADYDDSVFINLALGAFRSESGVFVLDTMLGDGPTAIHLPTYRVHSYELLFGTLGASLPGQAVVYAHFVLPVFFLAAFCGTLYLIYKPILGDWWLIGAVFHLAVLVAFIGGYRSYGGHGIFRLFQGKIVFLQVLIPLLLYVALTFYRKPSFQNWAFLFFIQISATGMTANSIYAAPLALGLAVFPFFVMGWTNPGVWKKSSMILATSIYPITIGLMLIMSGGAYPSQFEFPPLQAASLFSYFAWDAYGILAIALLPSCIYFCALILGNAYPIYYLLGLLLFIFNPLLWPLYSYVTGNLNFRVYWSVPFAFIFSVGASYCLFHILNCLPVSRSLKPKLSGSLALLVLSVVILDKTVMREQVIDIRWGLPYFKVVKDDYNLAKKVMLRTDQPCTALVPSAVAHHLTMIEQHPYPIAVSEMYQTHYRHTMNPDTRMYRSTLLHSVSDNTASPLSATFLYEAIIDFNIGSVLVSEHNESAAVFEAVGKPLGFVSEPLPGYRLFYRSCDELQ